MNAVLLDLGVIKIYWYSVIMFFAILIGGSLALKESKKWKIPEDFMVNLFFFIIPIALIGARLYFVAFHWDFYGNHLLDIFKVWEGGLAIHGGIIAGLIFIILYGRKYKINIKRLVDIIVVSLLLGQAIGRWGNFFNGEAHGAVTSLEALKWLPEFIREGMHINGVYYQPTFLYESLWCLIGFALALVIRKWSYLKIGNLTSFYLIWYGIGRFFIEGFRTDSLMLGNLKMAQIVSIGMIVIGIVYLLICYKGSKFDNRYNDKENVEHVIF
ncbi:MAG: prolipoprotein diacylglyceryl transferase [Bacilli bacterium]|nr:prolipoprotein diacylglyceryl transferase [Bacilli bacterium]